MDVAIEAAYLGGRRTLAYFNAGVAVEIKADQTPVTQADKEAEEVIRAHIGRHFPDHEVIGEEGGTKKGDSRYRWIVDPIDGTKTFICGVPFYGVLIGVEVDGRPAVGAIYMPAFDEMISAASGLGCHWNGRKTGVSKTAKLSDAVLLSTNIAACQNRSDAFDRLADIMLDPAMNPWDCAPMLPILTEAGGHFATWAGEPTIWGKDAFACNAALHTDVLAILKSEKRK